MSMSDDEWDAARKYLLASFPGLLGWMQRLPEEIAEGTRRQWRRVIGRHDVQAVMQAIDAMVDGSIERPRIYEDYPAVIAKHAAMIAGQRLSRGTRRTIDGIPTVSCSMCDDTGWVYVWQPSALSELREARRDGRSPLRERLTAGAVRCPCRVGKADQRHVGQVFDRQQDLPIRTIRGDGVFALPDPTEPAQIEAAYQWLGEAAKRRPNYAEEFAEFA